VETFGQPKNTYAKSRSGNSALVSLFLASRPRLLKLASSYWRLWKDTCNVECGYPQRGEQCRFINFRALSD
jgi:hypothetical protein